MPVISTEHQVVTLLNMFTVAAENQDRLVKILDEATEKVMCHRPGFISASVHASLDGTRVFNYAQWHSEDEFREALGHPDAQPHFAACREIADAEPRLYRVCFTEEA